MDNLFDKLKDVKIILASASPRRKEILSRMGLTFTVCPAEVDEKMTRSHPGECARELSRQKAQWVAENVMNKMKKPGFPQDDISDNNENLNGIHDTSDKYKAEKMQNNNRLGIVENNDIECIVIAADTIVSLDNVMLGKPKNVEDATKMIGVIQGKKHQVFTGVTVAIIKGEEIKYSSFYEKTDVFVAEMDENEIDHYISLGESMDKAGAYGIQGAFSIYVTRIEGDYDNVVGLPGAALYKSLKTLCL